MNPYDYLPSAISIYLVLISDFCSVFLINSVDNFVASNKHLEKSSELIKFVALDWANRLGFINSMVVALISVLPIYANTKGSFWAFIIFLVLVGIFVPMLFWIMSLRPGDLVATRTYRLKLTPSTICNYTLIAVNLVLAIAIYLSQNSGNVVQP